MKKSLHYSLLLSFLATILLIVTFSYHLKILISPQIQETRENSTIITTELLAEGQNPYSLSHMPENTNVYGILYNLVCFPFAKIFPSTYLLYRSISAFFIFASVFLLFKIIKIFKVRNTYAYIASVLFYSQIVGRGYDFLARPDSLGLFLFLSSFYVVFKHKFSNKSILFALVLSFLAFLAKPYFLISGFYISFYIFLTQSKKHAVIFVSTYIFGFLLLLLLVNTIFETYILNVIFISISASNNSLFHLFLQTGFYLMWNIEIVILLVLIFIFELNTKKLLKILSPEVCFLILSAFLLYTKLGWHQGNFITYFNHLISPFLFIVIFKNLNLIKSARIKNIGNILLFSVLVKMICYYLFFMPSVPYQIAQWNNWTNILKNKNDVYVHPDLSLLAFDQEKYIYDTGQAYYFKYALKYRSYIPNYQKISEDYNKYLENINQMVAEKKFDLIVLEPNSQEVIIPKDSLEKNYYPLQEADVKMFRYTQKLVVWFPVTKN